MRKGIPNRTQMTGKLVRMVHILLIKVLRRNAVFVGRLMVILQQLVQEKQKFIQYFACKKFVEMTPKERFQELRRKGYCFQCLSPGASQSTGKQWWEMSERIHLQKCITWQISNQKACSGMSWAQRNYRKWTASFRVQEQMHYEAN